MADHQLSLQKRARWLWIAVAVVVVDAITKALTHWYLPLMPVMGGAYPYNGIPVFSDFFGVEFSISHTTNTGAAWSMFSEYPWILFCARIGMIGGLIYAYFYYFHSRSDLIPMTLIIAGALGNVIDFILYGHVVDMLNFVLWGYDYPVFNVADSAICIGVTWFIIASWWSSTERSAPCL